MTRVRKERADKGKGKAKQVILPEAKPVTRQFSCPKCNASFKRKQGVSRHLDSVHEHSPVVYKCLNGPKTFSTKEIADAHFISVHLGIKYQCRYYVKDGEKKNYQCLTHYANHAKRMQHEREYHGEPYEHCIPEHLVDEVINAKKWTTISRSQIAEICTEDPAICNPPRKGRTRDTRSLDDASV